ncbi:restriction endonuclease subunit S [Paraglaciecola sp.]|uniref:restriction endonuclease subunit S n=1 Tax=Paraglaciecola sp. TaxID=1920173 RepID=UPI0030F404B0
MSIATENRINLGPYPQYPKSVKAGIPKLSDSKPGWQKRPIGELFDVVIRPVKMQDETVYNLVTVKRSRGGVTDREKLPGNKIAVKSQFYVEAGDFLISKRQIVHGACGFVPYELSGSIVSNEYSVLRCKDTILPEFLNYLMHTPYFQQTCFHSSIGVHVEKMIFKLEDWFKWKIYLPSKEEQKKIATFLSSVDGKLNKLRRKRELLETYKRGLMQKLFSQEIRFKKDDGSDFSDWDNVAIKNIGSTYSGLTGKAAEDFGSGHKFVTYKQVFGQSNIDTEHCSLVNIGDSENQNKVLRGDIIFTTSSEIPSEVGYSSVLVDEQEEDIYLNSFCFGLRPFSLDRTIPVFCSYLFRSQKYRKAIFPLAQGSTRYNLSKSSFLKIILDIPGEDEQRKIADFLVSFDQKIEAVVREIDQLETFKKGLLQKIFV